MSISSHLKSRMDAAMGRIPCDTVLRNARVLDVFSGRWRAADIAIAGGWIVGLDSGYAGREEIDLKGRAVVPGFIDAHVHVESSCMVPGSFERSVLPHGTTSAVCDPHELANVQGLSGIRYFLDASERMKMNLFVQLSSCVPATHLETNGGGGGRASQRGRSAGRAAAGCSLPWPAAGRRGLDQWLLAGCHGRVGGPLRRHFFFWIVMLPSASRKA